jgi:photosystem II stability/assembly factor-like uncharacterized protein
MSASDRRFVGLVSLYALFVLWLHLLVEHLPVAWAAFWYPAKLIGPDGRLKPEEWLWGVIPITYLPTGWRIAAILLLMALVGWVALGGGVPWPGLPFPQRPRTQALLAVLGWPLFYLGRVVHTRWGDAYLLVKGMAHPQVRLTYNWQAPLDTYLHARLFQLGERLWGWEDAMPAYWWLSSLAGVVVLWVLLRMAADIGRTPRERWVIFGLMATLGAMQLFFGYPENYTLLSLFILLFLWLAWRHHQGQGSLWGPGLTLAVAVGLHPSALILLPTLAVLGWLAWRRKGEPLRRVLAASVIPLVGVMAGVLVLMTAGGFGLEAFLGSQAPGGGDHRWLVPLTQVRSEWEYYTLFSRGHGMDILNQQLLVMPFTLPLLLLLGLGYRRTLPRDAYGLVLLVAAAAYVGLTWVWNPDYGGQRENIQDRQGDDGHEYGGVYKSTDGGESWTRVNSLNPRPMYFSLIRVDPNDDQIVYVGGISMHRSVDGGKTFRVDVAREVHADYHALWINPKDSRHILVGCDGGLYVSYDKMAKWDHLNHMALGQFYHVAVCPRKPYWAFGGLQDNGSWGLPSVSLSGRGPINEDVWSVGGGDGFVCRVDQTDPDWVYFESQNGVMGRRNLKTGERAAIRPRVERGQPPFRFNWNTPFILSHFNQRIFYCAGNYVFRSINRGDDLRIISPEITRTKRGSGTALSESPRNPDVLWVGTDDGFVWVTRDGGKNWTNVTEKIPLPGPRWVATLEASRFAEGRCYVAFDAHRSDDDKPYLFVTEDFGATWKPLHQGLPQFGSTRCLREDVVNPNLLYCGTEFAIFASVDRGQTWTKINNNLPTVAVHEVAVHPTAGEIVAATHGRSLWVLDVTWLRQFTAEVAKAPVHLFKPATVIRWRSEPSRGGTLRRFVGENPPPGTAIHYHLAKKAERVTIKIVDAEGKTVRELTGSPEAGLQRVSWNLARSPQRPGGSFGGFGGNRPRPTAPTATAPTPTATAPAPTAPSTPAAEAASGSGSPAPASGSAPAPAASAPASSPAPTAAAPQTPPTASSPAAEQPGTPSGMGGRRGGAFAAFGPPVPNGVYRVILVVDGKEYAETIRIEADPNLPPGAVGEEQEDELAIERLMRKIH